MILTKDCPAADCGHAGGSGTETVVSGADSSYLVPVDPGFPVILREKVKNQVTVLNSFEEMMVPMIKISIFLAAGDSGR